MPTPSSSGPSISGVSRKATVRLEEYPARDDPQAEGIRQRGKHFGPVVAERALERRGALRYPHGEQCEQDRRGVREHVPRVCEESEAAGQHAADHLYEHERGDQPQGEDQASLARSAQVVGVVMVVMVMPGVRVVSVALMTVIVFFVIVAVFGCHNHTLPSYKDGGPVYPKPPSKLVTG